MRVYLLLLVAVFTLLGSTNVSTVSANNLQPLKNHFQSTNAALRTGRLLKAEATTDETIDPVDEERGIADVIKKLGMSTKNWASDKLLAWDLYFKAMPMDLSKNVQKLVDKGVDPNRVYQVLKLDKKSNQAYKGFESGEVTLWKALVAAYEKANPNWVNAYKP